MKFPIPVAACALLFWACAPGRPVNPHGPAGIQCVDCHKERGDRVVPDLRSTNPIELCGSCHPDRREKGGEHAVGVKASRPGAPLPLDEQGNITCLTCHNPHEPRNASMLRLGPEQLCTVCHEK